jgi:hypothetical protein
MPDPGVAMRRLAKIDWRILVRLVSALSLVLVAFAHLPLDAWGRGVPNASDYAFPDGSIPVICVTLPAKNSNVLAAHLLPCGACLIAGSILVPIPAGLAPPSFEAGRAVVNAPVERLLERKAFPPSAPPQAPPLA